ncbi:hypothetical protein GEV29_08605 [Aeromicrobium sp. SMF47]|uniref:Uncharacterized protein n=1 Tax=Aeromicrobium yanjiei TaxID=2662028 RepID=A0A5Q2MMA9_9ACTN|nr:MULTISPECIES: C40 family peptidase [Aeromicrobium]MRJ76593.1 hypothetical protein [Aeromicrobium yanjiei]MRK00936.1 hypothetical protein [Aeromicrobium sp. S22]QGG42252.1 hypothetical protein GEV26_13220 [Aeromicrobium yanjiei]
MRTYTRVLATLFTALVVVLTGLTGTANAKTTTTTRADTVLKQAAKLKGKPYKWGGAGPRAFDCSGYVQYVYKKAGKKIGRTSGAQLKGKRIAKGKKKPGDILVFRRGGSAYHSAIYAGGGKMWEAQRTGVPVGKHKIWSQGYVVVRPGGGLKMTSTNKAVKTTIAGTHG